MDFAISTIELTNINQIKTDLKNPVLSEKFVKKYYQIIAKHVKYFNEKAKKLNESTIALEFINQDSTIKSIKNAVFASCLILEEIQQFNSTIPPKINTKLQVKIGIALNSTDNIVKFSVIERKNAKPFEILMSKAVHSKVPSDFEYEIIGPIPVKDEMVKFYKITKVIELESIKQQQQLAMQPKQEAPQQSAENQPQQPSQQYIEREIQEKEVEQQQQTPQSSKYSIDQALNGFEKVLKPAPYGKIIGLSGPDGCGKSTILNKAYQQIAVEMQTLWVKADCSKITTSEPYGLLRDMLKSMLNIPALNINTNDIVPVAQKNLEVFYQITDSDLIYDICSIIEGQPNKINENIFANKKFVFDSFTKLFNAILINKGLTFIIEDINYSDSVSVECINYMIENGLLEKASVILTYEEDVDVRTYINPINFNQDNIFTVSIAPPDEKTYEELFASLLNNQNVLSPTVKQRIVANSDGNLLYASETILYLIQSGLLFIENNMIKARPELETVAFAPNLESLFKTRLNLLEKNRPNSIIILYFAALQGYKFMPQLIARFLNLSQEDFVKELEYIGMSGLIISVDNFNCVFKHKTLWDFLYKQALNGEIAVGLNEKFYSVISQMNNNEASKLAVSAKIADLNNEYQDELVRKEEEAFILGDVLNYTEAQKALIEILESSLSQDKEAILAQLYENIGIMNYTLNPNDAVNYLSSAVVLYERLNKPSKMIDIAGYLSKSCELIGNYSGSIECADKALTLVDKTQMPIEYSLLIYSKLESLFSLGLLEEISILAQNDVIPVLSDVLDKQIEINGLNPSEILNILLKCELILAKSLAYQGNVLCLEVTKVLEERAKVFNQHSFVIEAKIIESIFKSIQGLTNESKAILGILKDSNPKIINHLGWNFATFLAGFISNDEENMINDGVKTLQIAEAEKDFTTHIIVKSLIGKVYKDINNLEKAQETYINMLEFATKSKLATPALLIWYLSSELSATINDFGEAETIINNAMPIAERANINNYLIRVLLSTVQINIEINRNNFEIAKIKIEEAIKITSEFKLFALEAILYLQYSQLHKKMAIQFEANRLQNIQTAHKICASIVGMVQKIGNNPLLARVQYELQSLTDLAQKAGISLQ